MLKWDCDGVHQACTGLMGGCNRGPRRPRPLFPAVHAPVERGQIKEGITAQSGLVTEKEGHTLSVPAMLPTIEPEDPDYAPGKSLTAETAGEAKPLPAEEAAACSTSQPRGK